jgi:hypothetical protein
VEQRRRNGLVVMGVGLVVAVIGEMVSHWWVLTAIVVVVATAGLIGGGLVVALSYREEAGRTSVSRVSLLASRASLRAQGSAGSDTAGPAIDPGAVVAYAARFNDELAACEALLAGASSAEEPAPATFDLEAARERLVTFVANPLYGEALRRGVVDEAKVRDVSRRLGAALEVRP